MSTVSGMTEGIAGVLAKWLGPRPLRALTELSPLQAEALCRAAGLSEAELGRVTVAVMGARNKAATL